MEAATATHSKDMVDIHSKAMVAATAMVRLWATAVTAVDMDMVHQWAMVAITVAGTDTHLEDLAAWAREVELRLDSELVYWVVWFLLMRWMMMVVVVMTAVEEMMVVASN